MLPELAGYWLCCFSSPYLLVFSSRLVHRVLRVSRRRAKLCKAFWDLDSELAEYCFCCILFGKVSHKSSPGSRDGGCHLSVGGASTSSRKGEWVKGRKCSHFCKQSSTLPNLIISSIASRWSHGPPWKTGRSLFYKAALCWKVLHYYASIKTLTS